MRSDYGVIGGAYRALVAEMGEKVKVFHYVPQGVMPPYVVLELGCLGRGNGLPSPHFQTRGELTVRVWSAYEGTTELDSLLGKVAFFFEKNQIKLELGKVWFEVKEMRWMAQQAHAKNPWREGRLELAFVLRQ
jgi:hypothetical protein